MFFNDEKEAFGTDIETVFQQASRKYSKKKAARCRFLAVVVFCVSLFIALMISAKCVCYAVVLDGTDMGTAANRAELINAVTAAELRASMILGQNISLADKLTVNADFGTGGDSVKTITDNLIGSLDGISYGYALCIDENVICTSTDYETLNFAISDIANKYTTSDTISVDFTQNVSIKSIFVNNSTLLTSEEIYELLDPENQDSPFRLTVVTVDSYSETVSIPFVTEFIYDDSLYSNESVVEKEGKGGLTAENFIVRRENGIVCSTLPAGAEVVVEPVAQILRVGTIEGTRTDSTGSYIWPTEGVISSYFGYRSGSIGSSYHKGLDIAGERGTQICASDGGTVIYADWASGYGWFMKILHDNGDITCYGHLSAFMAEEGDKVAQGEVIALMGSSGVSSGSHLHFEIRPNGENPANPLNYLSEQN